MGLLSLNITKRSANATVPSKMSDLPKPTVSTSPLQQKKVQQPTLKKKQGKLSLNKNKTNSSKKTINENDSNQAKTGAAKQKKEPKDPPTDWMHYVVKNFEAALKKCDNNSEQAVEMAYKVWLATKKEDDDFSDLQAMDVSEEPEQEELKTAKAPKKMKKPQKDPALPKKPKSAFIVYSSENRPQIKEANPDALFADLSKLVGSRWKDLSDEEKAPYLQQATDDKARYASEMAEYTPSQPKFDSLGNLKELEE